MRRTSVSRSGNNDFSNADTVLLMAPMGITRAGVYDYSNGNLLAQSSYGYYWSCRIASFAGSYRLDFHYGFVNSQDFSHRGFAFSVRCLAR